MQENLDIPIVPPPDRKRFSFALVLAAIGVLIAGASSYLWPGRQSPVQKSAALHLGTGTKEMEYAAKLKIENIQLTRAENFLHQEVTTISAELVNTGDQSVRAAEVTAEFSDDLAQVILRESRVIVAPPAAPIAAGERRAFEIPIEHVPPTWNMQQPRTRVTGLSF